MIKKFQKV